MSKLRLCLCLLAMISINTPVLAQLGLDKWLGMAAAVEPGQPIYKDGSKFVVHHKNAGVKGADGWYRASSTHGGFEIQFPAQITDATVEMHAPIDATQAFMTASTDTTSYVSTCARVTHVQVPASQIPELVQQMTEDLTDLKSEPFSRGTIQGYRYSGLRNGRIHVRGEMFALNGRLCFSMVGTVDHDPEDDDRVFGSFRPLATARANRK
jgi:hypothetical protein